MDIDSIILADVSDVAADNTLLIIIRIASIILVFAISILLGILPSKLTALSSNTKLIAYVNSFSAGLFLGLGLMHLLPESLEDFNQYLQSNPIEHPFPVPFGVAITSFSLILFIERILFQAHNFLHLHTDVEHHHHEEKEVSHHLHHHISEGEESHAPLLVGVDSLVLECNEEKEEEIFKKLISTKEKIAKVTIDMEFHKSVAADSRSILDKTSVHPAEITGVEAAHKNVAGPYAILIALSIHGMFEGAAVGIQTNASKAINLMIAVLLHKWAEALTLGVALFKGKLPYRTILIQLCVFSLSAPIGIVFGWALSHATFLISAIFKAISAGTFLYIAATELVVEEFSISTNMYSKFCMYLVGIVFMGLIVNFE